MRTLTEAILDGHLVWDPRTRVHSHSSGETVVESSSGIAVVTGPTELVTQLLDQARLGPAGVRTLLETHNPSELEHLLELCGNAFRVDTPRAELDVRAGLALGLIGDEAALSEATRRFARHCATPCTVHPWGIDRVPSSADLVVAWAPAEVSLAELDTLEQALRASGARFFLVASLGLGALIGPSGCGEIGCRYVDAYAELAGLEETRFIESLVTRELPSAFYPAVVNLVEARLLELLRNRELRGSGGRVDLVEWGGRTSRRLVFAEYRGRRDASVNEASERARSWALVMEADLRELATADRLGASTGPPMQQMLAFLRRHGAVAEKDDRVGRTLFDHLVGTHRILTAWGHGHPFTTFALFHSVYASQAVRRPLLSLHDRTLLRQLIGPAAEQLVFVFSTLDRQSLVERIEQRSDLGDLRNFVTDETIHCPELAQFFALFELANRCDLMTSPRGFDEIAGQVRRLEGTRWQPPIFDHGRASVTVRDLERAVDLASRQGDVLESLRQTTELVPWWPEPHVRYAAQLAKVGERAEARARARLGLERLLCWGTSFDHRATWDGWLLAAHALSRRGSAT